MSAESQPYSLTNIHYYLGDKLEGEQKTEKKSSLFLSFSKYLVNFHLGLVPVLGTGMKNERKEIKFPSSWNAYSSKPLSPVVRDLVRGTPFTHIEMLLPLQRMLMLSSPQVLRRGRPSCNQNLHKDVQGLDFIEPRKLYPHDHLREFAAITSITQRGVHISEESRWQASLNTPRLNHTCSEDPVLY